MQAIEHILSRPFVNRMGIRPPVTLALDEIIRQVCDKHGTTRKQIIGPRRTAVIVRARQEVYYRTSRETMMSLLAIGRLLNRDHTTILHGICEHEKRSAKTA
jgi:chromosomal replication initiation ATPase DnaA